MIPEPHTAAVTVSRLRMAYPSNPKRPVLNGIDFEVGLGERWALLGRNGQGKSTLIRLLGGVVSPTAGTIDWKVASSWPIGFGGGFQGSLTGLDNIRFLSRLYGQDYRTLLDKVDDFAQLGSRLHTPVKHYSSGMRARLAFGLSLAIEFDCYLIDELVAVGDASFQRRCREELFELRKNRTYIIASHDTNLISQVCDKALVIEGGTARAFNDIDEALEIYAWLKAA